MYARGSATEKTGILFVSSAEFPGADTFIHTLIMRSLDRSRFDVHVACSGSAQERTPAFAVLETIPDLHIKPARFGPSIFGQSKMAQAIRLGTGLTATIASFADLVRYIRRHRIRVLHSTDRPRDAVACAILGKLTGAKSIIHVHLKVAAWMGRPVRWAMGQVNALVGVSEFVARSLVDSGYRADRTHAVLNAIDLDVWDWRLDGSPVRRELGIPTDAPVVACAARVFKGKGQDDMIRALAAVQPEFPDARLLVIGGDDRQAMRTSFTEELKALAHDLGVADRVIFTGQRRDMPALFAASDIMALPSWEEPFGLVYAEAMAMKKPVMALNNGGAPEVIDHGKSGLLSKPLDADDLAANLRTLLRDPELRARMGEYGRHAVETRFTAPRMARDVENVYMSFAPSWGGRTSKAAAARRSTRSANEAARS